MVLLAFQSGDHLFNKIVDVKDVELHFRVIDRDGQVVGDVVAERGDGAVVVRTAPFSVEIGEPVNKNLYAVFLSIPRKRSSPAFLLRPYSLLPKRRKEMPVPNLRALQGLCSHASSACQEALRQSRNYRTELFRVLRPVYATRLNTKSHSEHHASSCSMVLFKSYSKTSSI